MSIKIKNPKSDKELASHSYREGKIVFNAGAKTGPKASEYMFNEASIPISGTNFQVKIKPQQTKEFDTAENSIQQIQIAQNAKDLNLEVVADVAPLQVKFFYDNDTDTIVCDKTYEELKRYGTNINAVYEEEDQGEIIIQHGLMQLPEGYFVYSNSVFYEIDGHETEASLKSPDYVTFYFFQDDIVSGDYTAYSVAPDNTIYFSYGEQNDNTNYYYISWDGSKYVLNDVAVDDNNTKYIVGYDKSVTSHIESIFNGYGYTKQPTIYTARTLDEIGNDFVLMLNQFGLTAGKYVTFAEERSSELNDEDNNNYSLSVFTVGAYMSERISDGDPFKVLDYTNSQFNFTVNNGKLELAEEPFTTDCDNINDMSQTYYAEFDVTIDFTTKIGTVTSNSAPVFESDKITKLSTITINNTEGYIVDIYQPRTSVLNGVIDEPFVTTSGVTIPTGSILYMFMICVGCGGESGEPEYGVLSLAVYAEPGTTTWNACLTEYFG